jgi:hypothetical protein
MMERMINHGVKIGIHCIVLLIAPGLFVAVSAAPSTEVSKARPLANEKLEVDARLRELPTSETCRDRRHVWVTTQYRVDKVYRGNVKVGDRLLVVHACPDKKRGFSSRSRGWAGRLAVGQRHRLRLSPWPPQRTPHVTLGHEGPLYRADRTDKAEAKPIIAITLQGGPGINRRIEIEGQSATVGRAVSSSVSLFDERLASTVARLRVKKETLLLFAENGHSLTINGKPIKAGQVVGYRDRIRFLDYEMRVSLLTAAWFKRTGRRR